MFNKLRFQYALKLYKLQAKQLMLANYIATHSSEDKALDNRIVKELILVLHELNQICVDMFNDGAINRSRLAEYKLAHKQAKEEVEDIIGQYIISEDE